MKISRQIIKGIALSMCALVLSFSISSACLPVYAEDLTLSASELSLEKIVDMSLTSTGVVASPAIIAKIIQKIIDSWTIVTVAYDAFCADAGVDKSCESLAEFMASDKYTVIGFNNGILEYLVNSGNDENTLYYLDIDTFEECLVGYSVGDKVHGGGGRRREFTISDDFVVYVRQLFNEYSETDADFYYIDTIGPDNIHPAWFSTKASYDLVKDIITNSPYPIIVRFLDGDEGTFFSTTTDNTSCFSGGSLEICDNGLFLVHNDALNTNGYLYHLSSYDNDWDNLTVKYGTTGGWVYHKYTNYEEFYAQCTRTSNLSSVYSHLEITLAYEDAYLGLCTNDGRKMRVFKDLNTMKLFSVGVQDYYITNNSDDYVTNNDNSVTFSGDYYTSTGDKYNYDVVQNEIDNSSEINENTVNNIVNEQTSTIINNYYTGGSSGDDGDDNGGGSSAGITDLIESIGGILNVVLSALASLINLLTTFIDSALKLLSGLGNTFAGFSSLLGALFVFIPQELIDSVTAGISLLIVLAVYKAFKK